MPQAASYDDIARQSRARWRRCCASARAAAEACAALPDETIADLRATGLFAASGRRAMAAARCRSARIIELGALLASGCGSTSWVYNNLVSHNWMLGYVAAPGAGRGVGRRSPETLIGSALSCPRGAARTVEGGWRLSGRWPFSSGVDPVPGSCSAASLRRARRRAPSRIIFLRAARAITASSTPGT